MRTKPSLERGLEAISALFGIALVSACVPDVSHGALGHIDAGLVRCESTMGGSLVSPSQPTAIYAYDGATRTLSAPGGRFLYDESGHLVLSEFTESPTSSTKYAYDEHGTLVLVTSHGSANDQVSSQRNQPRYEGGKLVSLDRVSFDGSATSTTRFRYDAEGRAIERTDVRGSNEATMTFRYNAQDQLAQTLEEWEIATYHYDAAGHLVELLIDGFGRDRMKPDGTPDQELHWTYDDAGQLVRFIQDGTQALDNPVVDGVIDVEFQFKGDCSALATIAPQMIAWIPNEPFSN